MEVCMPEVHEFIEKFDRLFSRVWSDLERWMGCNPLAPPVVDVRRAALLIVDVWGASSTVEHGPWPDAGPPSRWVRWVRQVEGWT